MISELCDFLVGGIPYYHSYQLCLHRPSGLERLDQRLPLPRKSDERLDCIGSPAPISDIDAFAV